MTVMRNGPEEEEPGKETRGFRHSCTWQPAHRSPQCTLHRSASQEKNSGGRNVDGSEGKGGRDLAHLFNSC